MFVLTPKQMRRVDAAAIEAGTPGLVLMERAGLGVARSILDRPQWLWGTTLVLCGKGNNGGDGLVVARILHGEGHGVRVLLLAPASDLSSDARTNLDRARERGVAIDHAEDDPESALLRANRESQGRLLVDAILGTGFAPPLREPLASLCAAVPTLGRRVVSLDAPSGLEGAEGSADAAVIHADLTLCLGFPKWGTVLAPGRKYCGRLERVDLELNRELVAKIVADETGVALYVDRTLALGWWKPRVVDAHKFEAGVVLAVGGSRGMSGAMTLACNAAYRAGAGLVEAVVPGSTRASVDSNCVETLVHGVQENDAGGISAAALAAIEARLDRKDVLLLGPGGGSDLDSAHLFVELMRRSKLPMVIDADALNALHRLQSDIVFAVPTVLTPHSGELSRLLGVSADELAANRRSLLSKAARELGAVVLHKGAPTFVASPDGSLAVIGAGGPGLATAGSGDVLAGAIAALLAGGQPAFEAACLGAYLHGCAGDRLERTRGVAGVLAGDLCDELATTIAEVERDHR